MAGPAASWACRTAGTAGCAPRSGSLSPSGGSHRRPPLLPSRPPPPPPGSPPPLPLRAAWLADAAAGGRIGTSCWLLLADLPKTEQDILIIIHSTSIWRFSEAGLHE